MTSTSYADFSNYCLRSWKLHNNAIGTQFALFSFVLSHTTTQKFRYRAKSFQVLFLATFIQCPSRLVSLCVSLKDEFYLMGKARKGRMICNGFQWET